jgi:hypothetical protein
MACSDEHRGRSRRLVTGDRGWSHKSSTQCQFLRFPARSCRQVLDPTRTLVFLVLGLRARSFSCLRLREQARRSVSESLTHRSLRWRSSLTQPILLAPLVRSIPVFFSFGLWFSFALLLGSVLAAALLQVARSSPSESGPCASKCATCSVIALRYSCPWTVFASVAGAPLAQRWRPLYCSCSRISQQGASLHELLCCLFSCQSKFQFFLVLVCVDCCKNSFRFYS